MTQDPEDLKAMQMIIWLRLTAMAPAASSTHEKQRLAAAMFNELVTKQNDATHAVWTENSTTMAAFLDVIVKSPDDCDLISLAIDCIALRNGVERDLAARSARIHGVYVEPDARRIQTFDDANGLQVEMPEVQGVPRGNASASPRGCLLTVVATALATTTWLCLVVICFS
jgi:hypothetical protein